MVNVPVSGLLAEPDSGLLRPIRGSSQSAYAGDPFVQGAELMVAAPNGRNALVKKDGVLYVLRRLDGQAPVWRSLGERPGELSHASWSENASALVLAYHAEKKIEIWTSMNDDPKLSGSVDTSSLEGDLVSLAVDRDGKAVFAAYQGEESGASLFLLRVNSFPLSLVPLNRPGAMAVNNGTLYVVDRGRDEVLQIKNWDFSMKVTTAASPGHGIDDPVGIATSEDGKLLFVASRKTQQIVAVDTATLLVKKTLDLDFRPTRLERSGTLFVLADGEAGRLPAQVLDPSRMLLIPVRVGIALPGSGNGD